MQITNNLVEQFTSKKEFTRAFKRLRTHFGELRVKKDIGLPNKLIRVILNWVHKIWSRACEK